MWEVYLLRKKKVYLLKTWPSSRPLKISSLKPKPSKSDPNLPYLNSGSELIQMESTELLLLENKDFHLLWKLTNLSLICLWLCICNYTWQICCHDKMSKQSNKPMNVLGTRENHWKRRWRESKPYLEADNHLSNPVYVISFTCLWED